METKIMLIVLLTVASCSGASQLAPFYDAVAKDPYVVMDMDLVKAVPSEEIPVLARVLSSGNHDLMLRAISGATEILQIHVNDARPHFRQLKPPIAKVKEEFQVLVPILISHFGDSDQNAETWNGVSDGAEILWKTRVVQFMGLLGAPMTNDMVNWMERVIQWPSDDGGRAEKASQLLDSQMRFVAAKNDPKLTDRLNGAADTNRRDELSIALQVIPVLAHLEPMPPSAMNALIERMDDSGEPYGASAAILGLSQNTSIDRVALSDRLVTKALDTKLPVDIRAAAIHGIGFLDVKSAKEKLRGLDRDANPVIAGSAIDAGVNDRVGMNR